MKLIASGSLWIKEVETGFIKDGECRSSLVGKESAASKEVDVGGPEANMLVFASPATSTIGYAYPAIGVSALVLGFTATGGSFKIQMGDMLRKFNGAVCSTSENTSRNPHLSDINSLCNFCSLIRCMT